MPRIEILQLNFLKTTSPSLHALGLFLTAAHFIFFRAGLFCMMQLIIWQFQLSIKLRFLSSCIFNFFPNCLSTCM